VKLALWHFNFYIEKYHPIFILRSILRRPIHICSKSWAYPNIVVLESLLNLCHFLVHSESLIWRGLFRFNIPRMVIYSVNLERTWSVSSLFVVRCFRWWALCRPIRKRCLATGSLEIDPLVDKPYKWLVLWCNLNFVTIKAVPSLCVM